MQLCELGMVHAWILHVSLQINLNKGREPNLAAALASQPAASHSFSFYYYCFMTLG